MAIRAVLAVFVALVSAACSLQSPTPKISPTFGPPDIRGVAYHGTWTSRDEVDRAAILDAIAAAGIPWVRLDVGWQNLQPISPDSYDEHAVAALDARLQEIADRGLSALVMLWWAPQWSTGTPDKRGVPRDPAEYARVAAWMVDKWHTQVSALQVWNEPNLPEFFESTSAADYAALLKATYPAVKAVRQDLTVVSAAPASLNQRWYADFYDQDVIGSYDALGAHPYPKAGDLPPSECERTQDTGCNMQWLMDYKARRGDHESPVWVTEFGYSTHPDTEDLLLWQRGVSEKEQAGYTAAMLAYFSRFPQVAAAFVYRDRDFTDSDVHQNGFGILRSDNSPKPVYDVITCSPASRCDELASES